MTDVFHWFPCSVIIIASQWSIRLSSHFASKGSIRLNSHFQRRDENKKLDPWLVKFCSCMSFHASLILIIHEVLLNMGVTFVSCILVFWPKCVFLHVCRRPVKKGFFLLLLALFQSVFVCVSGCIGANLHCKQYQLNKKEKNPCVLWTLG